MQNNEIVNVLLNEKWTEFMQNVFKVNFTQSSLPYIESTPNFDRQTLLLIMLF